MRPSVIQTAFHKSFSLYSQCLHSVMVSKAPPVFHTSYRLLSSGEVATALRPFYFVVHPDLFGQFPKERAVNENSLKQLNSHIEMLLINQPSRPAQVRFFLRSKPKASQEQFSKGFQMVQISLSSRDVRSTVHSILSSCNLPTSYIDSIPIPPSRDKTEAPDPLDKIWEMMQVAKEAERNVEEVIRNPNNLSGWLDKNIVSARELLTVNGSIREEIKILRKELCQQFGLADALWDCGWGLRHFRGCLQSFQAMATHYSEVMHILHGRTLVFGRESGVSLDGHVILNSGEVRHNWLDLIKNVPKHDLVILRVPAVEKAVSKALRDIQVVHRRFEPKRMANTYECHLRKLVTSLGDHQGRGGYPREWPDSLSHLQLVVEADAGPLMLSPTGQLIVPASCPAFLLVSFITEHMEEARSKLAQYERDKHLEQRLHDNCMTILGLSALEKDDNVTPTQMIHCCDRLIRNASTFEPLLQGVNLWISSYYLLLSDGEICIPWNWVDDTDEKIF